MRVAYVTAGTVGAGHVVRGVAIRRGLARAGFGGEYRMFGPPLELPAVAGLEGYQSVAIGGDRALLDPYLAAGSDLAIRLGEFRPDLLLVDLFWAPLHWVLPLLRCEAWLLLRQCPARWLKGPPSLPFDPSRFARVIAIEPGDFAPGAECLEPIVVVNPDESKPPHELRQRLGVPAGEEVVVVVHAGEAGEALELEQLAAPLAPRRLSLFSSSSFFPVAELLGGADRIFCGAGYNSVWEAHWMGYASRTTFLPFPRSIDDQARRLTEARGYTMRANGADLLAQWILG